ncbi:hypothetical protein GF357_03965 [Candidatus Dojkabacteria bacterium]|nr:hypothetical protein [Candidatus Dojkabacteria bacterium]
MKLKKPKLINYWRENGEKALPYLKDRSVTLEHVFDGKAVYRRYEPGSDKEPITISSLEDIIDKAEQYVYSFHPYIYSNVTNKGWFVLDIDDKAGDFELIKKIAYETAKVLGEDRGDFMLKFCGKDGFHIIFEWEDEMSESKCYQIGREYAFELAKKVYKRMNSGINIDFSAADQQDFLAANGERSKFESSNTNHNSLPTVVFDTKILHKHGNIRSPYSIHTSTNLASIPVSPDEIINFRKKHAAINS